MGYELKCAVCVKDVEDNIPTKFEVNWMKLNFLVKFKHFT